LSLWSASGLVDRRLAIHVQAFAERTCNANWVVFDYGCGTAPYRAHFERQGGEYIAADIEGNPDLRISADAGLPISSGSVNCVVSFQVLEHVRDVSTYLREARRILKSDGVLLLSTHGIWPYHPHPADYWRWTRAGLIEALRVNGFSAERMDSLCGPAIWMCVFPLLALKKFLGPLSPVLAPVFFATNFVANLVDRVTPVAVRDENSAIYVVEARPRS
jgi:SAM-dependent methyltransferase